MHTYGWYMTKMITEARAQGAKVVLVGLTVRDIWHGDIVERGPGNYSDLEAQLARAQQLEFLDLTSLVADAYEKLGPEKVNAFFPRDHTHTSAAGAALNASLVVAGLKRLGDVVPAGDYSPLGAALPPPPPHVRRPPPVAADPRLPSLFLIGRLDGEERPGRGRRAGGRWGWGEPLLAAEDFDAGKVNVVNRAVGGLSSRTYLTGGFWDRTLPLLKAGDVLIMQFGRNDGGAVNDTFRARATLPGNGEETQEIDNQLTKKHETVRTYGWYLRKFAADAKAKGGACPVICLLADAAAGPLARRRGRVSSPSPLWAAARRRKPAGAAFVDLEAIIDSRYAELGPERTESMYADPHTHNSWAGADLNAQCVIAGLEGAARRPAGR